jgi:hypothetical protein
VITLCLSNVFLPILSDGVHEEPIDFMYSSVYSGAVALKKLALEYTKGGSMALTDKAIQGPDILPGRSSAYAVVFGNGWTSDATGDAWRAPPWDARMTK